LATTTTQLDLPGLRERVLSVLRGLLEELGSHGALETLSVTSNLDRDLGLGSLERVELLTRLEAACDVRLPDTLAAEANTAEELIEAIRRAPGTATVEDEEPSAPRAALAAQRMHEQAAESMTRIEPTWSLRKRMNRERARRHSRLASWRLRRRDARMSWRGVECQRADEWR
jgi:acyl carrier protein